MEKLNFEDFKTIITNINNTLQDNKMFLSQLDSVIGDGDHGVSIAKGFLNAMNKIEEQDPANISDLLKLTGNSIAVVIGGVTGPVFGMFFSEMGRAIGPEKDEVDLNDLYLMFSQSLDKIMKVGGAKPGDKTMIDALDPAVKALKKAAEKNSSIENAFSEMASAAKAGAEATKNIIATKGRARYSGERSLGYEDAGANTIYLIFKTIHESIE
jgi:dihydroxyacetone kinase-like protein